MTADPTEVQVAILDACRVIIVRTTFRTGQIEPELQSAVRIILDDNRLTWEDLIEYASR